jgi:TatA/E family protein of Tat protein translocase
MPELLIILVVALLVLGPRKLPEVARSLGRGMAEFRRASTDLRNSLTAPIDDVKETIRDLEKDEAPPDDESAKSKSTKSPQSPNSNGG